VFSQNREDIETCIHDGLCPEQKLVYLGNGIDIDLFHPRNREPLAVERARGAERIARTSTVIGMVGRLTEEKGYRDYFAAARLVLAEEEDVTFLAIGPFEPEKADAIQQSEIDALGFADHLRVLGHRTDVARLYAAMDVFVLPSHREGFPRAPMEAAATGLPVLVSDERGCRETVIDGASGFLVPQRDPRQLAKAMLRLIRDKPLRERLGARGRILAEDRFDQRNVFAKVVRGYEALVEGDEAVARGSL
jgi:glycosyltransferase involved in cell wall biosynthesis